MNQDALDKSLKARVELFKIYIVVVIGLVTGISSLSFNEFSLFNMLWMIIGGAMLVLVMFITVSTYFKIRSLITKLESS